MSTLSTTPATSAPLPLRRKFGPVILGIYPRPAIAGELTDAEVTAGVKDVRAAASGLIDIDVSFVVAPYDPTETSVLAELHAIAFPPGHGIPTDPDLAVASQLPMASTTSTGTSVGGEVVVTIEGAETGKLKIITVLSYPGVVVPTDPTTPVVADATTPVVADPTTPVVADATTPIVVEPTTPVATDPTDATTSSPAS
jgi:hypothetical protein